MLAGQSLCKQLFQLATIILIYQREKFMWLNTCKRTELIVACHPFGWILPTTTDGLNSKNKNLGRQFKETFLLILNKLCSYILSRPIATTRYPNAYSSRLCCRSFLFQGCIAKMQTIMFICGLYRLMLPGIQLGELPVQCTGLWLAHTIYSYWVMIYHTSWCVHLNEIWAKMVM